MKEIFSDVLIVGGGMAGLLMALALGDTKNNIIVIDKNKFTQNQKFNADVRTTAISEGSKIFLEKINLWKNIYTKAEVIKKIKVIDREEKNKINFFNSEANIPLGYVVKNSIIKREIIKILKTKQNVKILEDEKINDLILGNDKAIAKTNKNIIISSLVIAADGKYSTVKKIVNTKQFLKKYNHKALVTNINHTNSHNNTAFEIFYKSGPLAILPMKSNSKNYYSSSIIWTNDKNYTENIYALKETYKIKIIEEKISKFIGSITNIVNTKIFDLSAHLNKKFYDKRMVYIGDSAHSVHPIAGQGWNLGVRDVEKIRNTIIYAEKFGLDIGSNKVCKDYHSLAYNDAYSMFQITDKLNSIFLNDTYIGSSLRKTGISFIEKNQLLKKYITNYAMGF